MRKALIYIFLSILSFSTFGQEHVDSLRRILPDLKGQDRADVLQQLSFYYSKFDSAKCFYYADQALQWSTDNENKSIKAMAFFNKAECYYAFERYSKALNNYQQALDLFNEQNDSVNSCETLNSIGLVYYFEGQYNSSAKSFYRALDFLNSNQTRGNAAHVYSNLGMLNNRIDDNNSSIYNYKLAAKLNREIHDTASLAVNYNGQGVVYYSLNEYDSAKVYYQKALDLFRILKNKKREAIALNNIANIYVNVGDSLNLALEYYKKALTVFEELNDLRSKAFVLEGLGSVYRDEGHFDKAISAFNNSLQLAEQHHLGFFIKQLNYNDLALTYERLGRVQSAFNAFKKYSQFKDSLLSEERLNQVADLEKKYETQQKQAEINRLNASRQIDHLQIKRDKELRSFGIIIILLLVSVTLIISIAYINKRQINEILSKKNAKIEDQRLELEKLNASKNRFFSIIAHDLKNPFHTVMGYSYLLDDEYENLPDMERKRYAKGIHRSANSIFRLLENLLDWSRSQTGRIKFNPRELDFRDIYDNIQTLLKPSADQKHIQLIAEIDGDAKVFADPMMLETILRNLMNNAIKYTNQDGWVKTIVRNEGTRLQVCVQDNGVGIDQMELSKLFQIDSNVRRKGTNQEDGSGLGLIICEEFVKKNGGSIWVDSQQGHGSQFYFTIPRS